MKTIKNYFFTTLLIGLFLCPAVVYSQSAREYPIIDVHLHYLDFLQRTDGFEKLVEKMDEANVSHAVIFGMPMAKQWDEHAPNEPTYYLSNDSRTYYFSATDYILMRELQKQPEGIRHRFFPFVGGINPNDRNAAKYLRQIIDLYPGMIYGIGELMSRHDDLTALTYGEPPRADHPALLEVYDLAAELNMPVLLHHNLTGVYMTEILYLEEMKAALAHNRDANIIWAHVGISRRITVPNAVFIEMTESMLSENKNLYYDISWVVFEDFILPNIDAWAALINKYPDRFLIGSDKVGHWETYPQEITKYDQLLDVLSEDAKRMVSGDNVLRLINVLH